MPTKSSHESSSKGCEDQQHPMKVEAVAQRLNNSLSTIYALIETGKLEHYRCRGIRVSGEQLARYLENARRGGRVERPKRPTQRPKLNHIRLS